ncbi:CPBP family intramembrane metalloprotease [Halobellus sp. Atlit-38R]|uniref:CPBP family intramembrane glutamic endopeptidase n=1 Tax=Halobellus sp. Atlit-38R TaxID=2282131 RepID=UPI000EF25510|nr:type II CAAX endopeptidase family protein [Halobellus sp. Atlit-38R]RLM84260.1 CPBP family intramembrane metalloprotease [Halobellus sp. Atlit-38R]
MRSIRKQIGDHPVLAFFVGAYAITWGIWFPVLSAIDRGLIAYNTPALVVLVAGSFGPPLSAAIVTYLTGGSLKRWFSQVLRWRVAPRWWLAAFGLPLILYTLMAAVHLLLGGKLNSNEVNPLASIPLAYLNIFFWGGGNEELGWRGFALPYLQERYSALASSLVIGVVWAVWHAPSGIIERGVTGWAVDLPIYAVIVVGISIVATLLYNNTGGSVLITMVFHAGVNAAQGLYPVEGMFTPTGELARFVAWAVLVGVLLAVFGWRSLARGDVAGAAQAGARHRSDRGESGHSHPTD